jgi:hypothetical protein
MGATTHLHFFQCLWLALTLPHYCPSLAVGAPAHQVQGLGLGYGELAEEHALNLHAVQACVSMLLSQNTYRMHHVFESCLQCDSRWRWMVAGAGHLHTVCKLNAACVPASVAAGALTRPWTSKEKAWYMWSGATADLVGSGLLVLLLLAAPCCGFTVTGLSRGALARKRYTARIQTEPHTISHSLRMLPCPHQLLIPCHLSTADMVVITVAGTPSSVHQCSCSISPTTRQSVYVHREQSLSAHLSCCVCDTRDLQKQDRSAAAMAFSSAVGRLSVLSQHLSADCEAATLQRQETRADEDVRPAPGGGPGTLTVLDNRTGKKYTVSALAPADCLASVVHVSSSSNSDDTTVFRCWECDA